MTDRNPPSRPALRKSVDATVHPALGGRPHAAGQLTGSGSTKGGPAPEPAPGGDAAAKPLRKSKRSATSDVLRPSKQDPAVTLKVEVPKSLRKKLRSSAKEQGLEPAVLAARLIADGLR